MKELLLTDQLLHTAFAFRKVELWNVLDDSNLFAVKLSSGNIAYCCVMGQAGEHHSLGVYEGDKCFTTYLKTISLSEKSQQGMLQDVVTYDCINCDFVPAKLLMPAAKKRVREYATAHNVTISRKYGWPDIVRFRPGHVSWSLTEEHDVQVAIEAMTAATWLAGQLQHSGTTPAAFGFCNEYPTPNDQMQVPLLVPTANGDGYTVERTVLPGFVLDLHVPAPIPADLAAQVKKLPVSAAVKAKCFYSNAPIMYDDDEVPCYPLMLIQMDSASGLLLSPCLPLNSDADSVLLMLAQSMLSSRKKPVIMKTYDDKTANLLRGFCNQCGIRLVENKEDDADLNDAADYCFNIMGMMN